MLGGGERNAESELAVTCSEPADFVSTYSWAIAGPKFHKIHRLLRVPPTSSAESIRGTASRMPADEVAGGVARANRDGVGNRP
jgi:hypothetical protein